MRLQGKVSIITGAASGIGRATALKFAREGAIVAVCDLNQGAIDEVVAEIKAAGGKVKLVKMNIDEHPQIPGQLGIQSIPAVIAFKQGQPVDALLKEARVWGARQSLFKRALPRVTETAANAALEDAARIDRMIKGIGGGDVWTEFLRLGLRLAGQ